MTAVPVFTVTRKGAKKDLTGNRYALTISTLPGRAWTYGFTKMRRELMISALCEPAEARNAMLGAYSRGSVTISGGRVQPDPVAEQREQAVRALAARAHVRKTYRRRYPDLARSRETEITCLAKEMGGASLCSTGITTTTILSRWPSGCPLSIRSATVSPAAAASRTTTTSRA